jgi:hypothetical protein
MRARGAGLPWSLQVVQVGVPEQLVNWFSPFVMAFRPAPSGGGAVQRRLQCLHSALSDALPDAGDSQAVASSPMAAPGEASDEIQQPGMHPRELDGDPGARLTARDIELFKENGYLVKRNLLSQTELQVCLDKFWAAAPESIRRDAPESWVDPARHDDWATEIPPGYERGEHNRGGTRWTAHALGHDEAFLAATARHPDALRVVEALIGGPVKLPGRNRGIYAIFPTSQDGNLGPHVDSHTFECQMVTYLAQVGDNSGGFTVWPGVRMQARIIILATHAGVLCFLRNDLIDAVCFWTMPVDGLRLGRSPTSTSIVPTTRSSTGYQTIVFRVWSNTSRLPSSPSR